MKRKALTGLAALTLFDIVTAQGQAQAQVPAPIANWTGFYVGVNVGVRWGHFDGSAPAAGTPFFDAFSNFNQPVFAVPFSFNANSGVAGLHGGHNTQLSPNWLVGFEVDVTWGRGSGSSSFSFADIPNNTSGTVLFSGKIDWSMSLRGRAGYTVGSWLLYVTAGLSIARVSVSASGATNGAGTFTCGDFFTCIFTTSSTSAFSASQLVPGGVIGGGLEYQFATSWIFRVEYLFTSYGTVDFGNAIINTTYFDTFCFCTIQTGANGNVTARLTTQTLRVGLSFKLP
jgi:outer membrane immunogenic protein